MAVWQGKWALVTGASAGIGLELATQLAAGGANLVLTARRSDRLTQLADDLRAKHKIQTEVFPSDLTQLQAPDELFHSTEAKGLPIDVLINNAGFGAYGYFHKNDRQRYLEMVQVNVAAVVSLTHLYLPAMVARRSGYIMIVASTAAFQAVPYISTYAATKAFDLLFAEGIAAEVRRYGVRVSALCPGSTESEFFEVAKQPEYSGRTPETAEKVARVGLEALAAGKSRVISGGRNWLGVEMQRLVPHSFVTRVVERLFAPKE
jgi:short-subunit dehydrogenase